LKLEAPEDFAVLAAVPVRAVIFALALGGAAACMTGCGSNSTRGAGDGFVGTWYCPQLPAGSRTLQIGEDLDNSLWISGDADAGSSSFCQSDSWSYAGSTVSMKSGTSCLGGADGLSVITIQSFILERQGSALLLNATETVLSSDKTSKKLTLVASCQKQ
jgi:hypothetical protein